MENGLKSQGKMMKAKPISDDLTPDLYRSQLKNILNLNHELCQLSELIHWKKLDTEMEKLFPSSAGCPATPTRLIMGLFYLKATFKVSDENLPRLWIENPYWQYFCGEQYLQHKFPIDPSSMSKWRKRLKESDCERLLEETIRVGLQTETITKKDLKKTMADTTVQEKAITFPTDSKLYHKGRQLLVAEALKHGIKLKQNYNRLGKRALWRSSNYMRAQQMNRAKKEIKKLKTYLGRVYRQIQKQIKQQPDVIAHFNELFEKVDRVLRQEKTDKNKLYSFHAPETECISNDSPAFVQMTAWSI
jgi:IS5 family transposase